MSAAFEVGDRENLSAIDRLLLLRLGDWSDDSGYCWPGVEDLSAKVGVDRRTIYRHLASLEAAGLLLRIYGKGGRNRSNLYRILPEVLPDDPNSAGRIRYQRRFGIKGDSLSPFNSETGTGRTGNRDRGDAKQRHSSVTRSNRIHQEPSGAVSNLKEPEGIFDSKFDRLPGESRTEAIRRILG